MCVKIWRNILLLVASAVAVLLVYSATPPTPARSLTGDITGTPLYLPLVIKFPTPTLTFTTTPTRTKTPTATITRTPTLQVKITGNVQIISIFYDGSGDYEPDEYVVIQNKDANPIQLQNWTLRDIANHIYTFPSFVIQPNQTCRVYTNQSHPETCNFNYGSGTAIWNNSGDTAYLRNSANILIDTYSY